MSGFRTPYYNHAIGDVKYSMHQWGKRRGHLYRPSKRIAWRI